MVESLKVGSGSKGAERTAESTDQVSDPVLPTAATPLSFSLDANPAVPETGGADDDDLSLMLDLDSEREFDLDGPGDDDLEVDLD
jgi:hypothetical protein